jgi:HD-GYP domain-containing protein (c-di-GMP phosphodiesterase class II)
MRPILDWLSREAAQPAPVDVEPVRLTFTPLRRLEPARELVAAIQELALARSITEIQDIVRKAARRLTSADGATFVLRDNEQCYYADEDAISPLWKGQRFPLEACISGWAMLNREPAVIEDIYADDRIPHDAYRPTFVKSLAMVPIRTLDPVGAIGNYWAERHQPTDREVELLQALADSTAVAMENVRAYDELERAGLDTLRRLALAAEYRDDATHMHTERVGNTAAEIAARLALPAGEVELIRLAAPLHDIGKIAIPDTILLKPGKLTAEEWTIMRRHTIDGARLLTGSDHKVLRLAELIALYHHEWWNGTGYQQGLKGDDIPLCARIVALADAFDALTHERPYKPAWPLLQALHEIRSLRGRQFDPDVVDALLELDTPALAYPGSETSQAA